MGCNNVCASSEPHDFTGKDMKVYAGNKGRYLGLPFYLEAREGYKSELDDITGRYF